MNGVEVALWRITGAVGNILIVAGLAVLILLGGKAIDALMARVDKMAQDEDRGI